MRAVAEQENSRINQWIGARIGYQVWDSSALPQVTGLASTWLKIVKVFGFMPLSSAPAGFEPALTAPEGLLCTALACPFVLKEGVRGAYGAWDRGRARAVAFPEHAARPITTPRVDTISRTAAGGPPTVRRTAVTLCLALTLMA